MNKRAVPEPPLRRMLTIAGFYGIGAVYWHGNAMHQVQGGWIPACARNNGKREGDHEGLVPTEMLEGERVCYGGEIHSAQASAAFGMTGGEGAHEGRPYGDAGGRGFATAARFLGSASLRSE